MKIGLFGALTIAFIVLKLTKVIKWGWWAVLSPVWIPFCLAIIVIFVQALLRK